MSEEQINVKLAEKVVFAPAEDGVIIRASSKIIREKFLGEVVSKGDVLALNFNKKNKDDSDSSVSSNPFLEAMSFFHSGGLKVKVIETKPEDQVRIVENTEIILEPELKKEEQHVLSYLLASKTLKINLKRMKEKGLNPNNITIEL